MAGHFHTPPTPLLNHLQSSLCSQQLLLCSFDIVYRTPYSSTEKLKQQTNGSHIIYWILSKNKSQAARFTPQIVQQHTTWRNKIFPLHPQSEVLHLFLWISASFFSSLLLWRITTGTTFRASSCYPNKFQSKHQSCRITNTAGTGNFTLLSRLAWQTFSLHVSRAVNHDMTREVLFEPYIIHRWPKLCRFWPAMKTV